MLYRAGNMPYTKPTLNITDSVSECKTDIKHICWYNHAISIPHMQIWTVLSNRDYTGFEPESLASKVIV